jgi:hypothetical protein
MMDSKLIGESEMEAINSPFAASFDRLQASPPEQVDARDRAQSDRAHGALCAVDAICSWIKRRN